jgi:hypothetical protein
MPGWHPCRVGYASGRSPARSREEVS